MPEPDLDDRVAFHRLMLHEPIAELVGSIGGLTLLELPESVEPVGSPDEMLSTYSYLGASVERGPPRTDEAVRRRFRREMLASLGPHDVFHLAVHLGTGSALASSGKRPRVWATFRVDPTRRDGDWFDELPECGVAQSMLLSGDTDAALLYRVHKGPAAGDEARAVRGLRAASPAARVARAQSLADDEAERSRSFGALLTSLPDVERVEPDSSVGERLWAGAPVSVACSWLEPAEIDDLSSGRLDPPGAQPERTYVDAWLAGLIDRLGPNDRYAVALGPSLGGWKRIAVRDPRRWLFDLWGAPLPRNPERPLPPWSLPLEVDRLTVLSDDGERALLILFDWNGCRFKARLPPTATLLNRAESYERLTAVLARSEGLRALSLSEQNQGPPDKVKVTSLPSLAADAPRADRRRWFKAGLSVAPRFVAARPVSEPSKSGEDHASGIPRPGLVHNPAATRGSTKRPRGLSVPRKRETAPRKGRSVGRRRLARVLTAPSSAPLALSNASAARCDGTPSKVREDHCCAEASGPIAVRRRPRPRRPTHHQGASYAAGRTMLRPWPDTADAAARGGMAEPRGCAATAAQRALVSPRHPARPGHRRAPARPPDQ